MSKVEISNFDSNCQNPVTISASKVSGLFSDFHFVLLKDLRSMAAKFSVFKIIES